MSQESSSPRRWDTSLFIAFVAVLISCVSALISWREARTMEKQQEILISQQEASVWPYLDNSPYLSFEGDTAIEFRYAIENKGIGPAIIGEVNYSLAEEEVAPWGLGDVLNKKHSDSIEIKQNQNAVLDYAVLAPGETHTVIGISMMRKAGHEVQLGVFANQLIQDYRLEYCYCSVYGKCWRVKGIRDTAPATDCEFRADIR